MIISRIVKQITSSDKIYYDYVKLARYEDKLIWECTNNRYGYPNQNTDQYDFIKYIDEWFQKENGPCYLPFEEGDL